MTPSGRLFLAVDPPAAVRAELGRWARSALAPGERPVGGREPRAGSREQPGGRREPRAGRREQPGGRREPRSGSREQAGGRRERPGRAPSDGIRRVGVDGLHITVCFLGDQPLDLVEEIGEVVRGAVIDLARGGLSAGPLAVGAPVWLPPRRPRALALEIHDESGGLTALYEDLRQGLGSAIGWEPERRRFRPHITLARLRTWAPPPECVEPTPALVFEPESITLYRSWLEPDGAVYEGLVRVGLGIAGGASSPSPW